MPALSENIVKSLAWEGKDRRILDGQRLYLNRHRNSKTWINQKKYRGKNRIITLDKWPAISCKQARPDARQYTDESDISRNTVSNLISEYRTDVVYPESKMPNQVVMYLNLIEMAPGRFKLPAGMLTIMLRNFSS